MDKLKNIARDFMWFIKRITAGRYLKVKVKSLRPTIKDWNDADVIMLHTCFQILADFIEKEGFDEYSEKIAGSFVHITSEEDPKGMKYKAFKKEATELYMWWNSRKHNELTYVKEDTEMLQRLMKIRTHLWR